MDGDSRSDAAGQISVRGAHCLVNGVRLHYLDFDCDKTRTPMLILPGITSPAATWAFVARHFAEERRVVVADIRGRGLSDNRPGLDYRLDDYAADALGMIEAAGLEKPILLGHSMGARIGIRLAATCPSSLSALIMVDPPLTGPGRPPYPTPLASYLSAHEAASRGAAIEEFRRFNPSWTAARIAERLEWLPTCSPESIVATYGYFHSEDVHSDLPHISCPSLLVRAARASVVTREGAAEVAKLMKSVETAELDAGHMIPWDDLPAFLGCINGYLNERDQIGS